MHHLASLFPQSDQQQLGKLAAYLQLLQEWNQRINLVSRKDIANLVENHLLPSLIVLKMVMIPENAWVLDIGSGGGFPAIPLKIIRPDLQLLMVESTQKKAVFLQEAVKTLELEGASVMSIRVESLREQRAFLQKFDWITARAVGSIPQLIEWGKPYLRKGGGWLLWKGASDIAKLKDPNPFKSYPVTVHRVPAAYHALSGKFAEMCIFEIAAPGKDAHRKPAK